VPLITVEGIDGAGKTSAITEIAMRLAAQGLPVVIASDFSSCPVARMLKPLMVGERNPWAQYALIMAARVVTHRTLVEEALREGALVLYDRYVDSTHAYQGALGVERSRIDQDHAQCALPLPDLTLMLDLPVEIACARKGAGTDRMDSLPLDFYQTVRHAFLERSLHLSPRHALINAARDLAAVADSCMHAIKLHVLQDSNRAVLPAEPLAVAVDGRC
jgi:dTMP kinase